MRFQWDVFDRAPWGSSMDYSNRMFCCLARKLMFRTRQRSVRMNSRFSRCWFLSQSDFGSGTSYWRLDQKAVNLPLRFRKQTSLHFLCDSTDLHSRCKVTSSSQESIAANNNNSIIKFLFEIIFGITRRCKLKNHLFSKRGSATLLNHREIHKTT